MFENIINIFKKGKKNKTLNSNSKDTAKERLHLVLMQDRANVSADFLDLMRKEIIEVIKKYIDIDEKSMDVRLTTETNEDGTQGAPALYANIPIINIKDETRKNSKVNTVNSNVKVESKSAETEKKEENDKNEETLKKEKNTEEDAHQNEKQTDVNNSTKDLQDTDKTQNLEDEKENKDEE